jgi:hypothetical protein
MQSLDPVCKREKARRGKGCEGYDGGCTQSQTRKKRGNAHRARRRHGPSRFTRESRRRYGKQKQFQLCKTFRNRNCWSPTVDLRRRQKKWFKEVSSHSPIYLICRPGARFPSSSLRRSTDSRDPASHDIHRHPYDTSVKTIQSIWLPVVHCSVSTECSHYVTRHLKCSLTWCSFLGNQWEISIPANAGPKIMAFFGLFER